MTPTKGGLKSLPRLKKAKKKRDKNLEKIQNVDIILVFVVVLLVIIGVIMVFSASFTLAGQREIFGFDHAYFLHRHIPFAVFGLFAMWFASKVNYRLLVKFITPLYILSVGLLIYVFIYSLITGSDGRWISVPVIGQFQPSELAKAALIMLLARNIGLNNALRSTRGIFNSLFHVGLIAGLTGTRDLGTAIVIGATGMSIIFIASKPFWRFVILGAGAISGILGYLYLATQQEGAWRGARVLAWQDPFAYMYTTGWQIVHSLYAIASGGLFGLGIGQSRQKSILPEAQTDVIFAVIIEELGLINAGFIIFLFIVLIWRGIVIAGNARDNFGSLLAAGVVFNIAFGALINIAVTSNVIPNTGIPLPFISYGGTALLVTLGLVGITLNVSRYVK